jgi:hypothetical protein
MPRHALIGHPLRAGAMAAAFFFLPPGAAALADDYGGPEIKERPQISGTAQVGSTLTASADWTGDPAPTATWVWLRCAKPRGWCSAIADATSDTYRVAAADVGAYLRVRLTVTNTAGSDRARSDATDPVEPAPQPVPSPTPAPTAPQPIPAPVSPPIPAPPPPQPTTTPPVAARAPLVMLAPFPVVRLRGSLSRSGARINLFTVRVPGHVVVRVRCRGSSCPVRRIVRHASTRRTIRLKRLERHLRAGTRLEVKVTGAGRIGKWSTIVIRRGAAPRRADRCAFPDAGAPAPCPA